MAADKTIPRKDRKTRKEKKGKPNSQHFSQKKRKAQACKGEEEKCAKEKAPINVYFRRVRHPHQVKRQD